MAADKLDVVRRFVDAFNRLDFDAIAVDLDPEVELHEWPEAPGAGSYRGRDGVQQALESWFDVWEWMRVEIEQLIELGDRVLINLQQRAKGKGSAVEVEIRSFNVYTFRGSKVARIELFTEEEPALRAAGLGDEPGQRDPDRLRQVNDAVARGDLAALADSVHPDIVWEHNLGVGSPEEGVYRGRESLIALFERVLEPWEQLRPVPREIRRLDEGTYVVSGDLHAKHRTSQTEIATHYELTLEFRDGLLVRGAMTTGSLAPAAGGSAAA